MIGDAFREESLARRTSNDSTNNPNQNADEFDKLILIGIVSTSNLKNAELFNGLQVLLTFFLQNIIRALKFLFILNKKGRR